MRIGPNVKVLTSKINKVNKHLNPQEGGQQMATIIEDMTNEQTIAIVGSVKVGEL